MNEQATLRSHLSVCIFIESESLIDAVGQPLIDDRYLSTVIQSDEEFFTFIAQAKQRLDCLVLEDTLKLPPIANWLHGQAVLLPAVILSDDPNLSADHSKPKKAAQLAHALDSVFTYHTAEVWIAPTQIGQIYGHIEQAIKQFLKLAPTCQLNDLDLAADLINDTTTENF